MILGVGLALISLFAGFAANASTPHEKPSRRIAAVNECDRLATRPLDQSSPARGVRSDAIEFEKAIAACRLAARAFPTTGRFQTQLARALIRARRYGQAGRALKIAEALNHPPAFALIGEMFEKGLSVVSNARRARAYYERAAGQGDAYGRYHLGRLLLNGIGGPPKRNQALQLLQAAARQGVPEAYYLLAKAENERHARDIGKITGWLKKAAAKGHPGAQDWLGRLLASGGDKSEKAAFEWSLKAAESGVGTAQARVGVAYLDGKGTIRNVKAGIDWLKKAAARGQGPAQRRLGLVYSRGEGVKVNYHAALKYLYEAARLGDAEAFYELGNMYAAGHGVKANTGRARHFFRQASRGGYAPARQKLEELRQAAAMDSALSPVTAVNETGMALASVRLASFGFIGSLD